MKKIIVVVLVVVFVLLLAFGTWFVFSDSNGEESPTPTVSPTSPAVSPTAEPTPTPPDTTNGNGGNDQNDPNDELLRNIPPELIRLSEPDEVRSRLQLSFNPSFRLEYYAISVDLDSILGYEAVNAWASNLRMSYDLGDEPNQSFTFAAITYFNITRNKFMQLVEDYMQANLAMHREGLIDIFNEFHETPNLNLLFTFNNELINRYYSRDLVVAQAAYEELQEWLQHNQPYESYSAFRAANP